MKMTGADMIVEILLENGADTIFGYPGGAAMNVYDSIYKNSDRIRHMPQTVTPGLRERPEWSCRRAVRELLTWLPG